MTDYIKLALIALITAVLVLTVRQYSAPIAAVLAIAGCCLCIYFVCDLAAPVVSFLNETAAAAGIGNELLSPLLKTVGIGFLTQFSADICTDAGQSTLAKAAQTGGTVLCICISLPLFQAVLALVQTLTGG